MEGMDLSVAELHAYRPGEAITLSAVLAILVISVITVVVFRLFRSGDGSVKLPGGWAFSWK